MKIEYQPKGVCSKFISIDLDDNNLITDVVFIGGCQGNLKAISKLLIGKSANEAVELLKGITCGNKSTSCADQLATALIEALS